VPSATGATGRVNVPPVTVASNGTPLRSSSRYVRASSTPAVTPTCSVPAG
jgi:hypothetical protein